MGSSSLRVTDTNKSIGIQSIATRPQMFISMENIDVISESITYDALNLNDHSVISISYAALCIFIVDHFLMGFRRRIDFVSYKRRNSTKSGKSHVCKTTAN